ncbi:VOC family protein [Croceicoccus gelatinilyticus]|uniref:VOC family protein n=1 Tax=Croceicoccus gelatinilyticus TaxID=2835536 RepID=UPI001BCECEB2|nr:VOC family protein [Croceicoccus gelatinilyticus]MBS7670516.1 VOC family protein [Croceicoccus gelatinilyticus]
MPEALPVRQIAYFVPDVRKAATEHHTLYGSGPFFVAENIPLGTATHRGNPATLDHTSAYGQWGSVMVEFVQQNNAGPSAFHDMYSEGSGESGLHHIALFVESIEDEIAHYAAAGYEVAFDALMEDGFRFAFIDTVKTHGHMIELYEPTDSLLGFYGLVADKAGRFEDGLLIDISLG